MSALTLTSIGAVLIVAGFLLPLLMVLHVVESGFALSILGYVCSLLGLPAAVYGILSRPGAARNGAQRSV
jgi:hypothetical protein